MRDLGFLARDYQPDIKLPKHYTRLVSSGHIPAVKGENNRGQ